MNTPVYQELRKRIEYTYKKSLVSNAIKGFLLLLCFVFAGGTLFSVLALSGADNFVFRYILFSLYAFITIGLFIYLFLLPLLKRAGLFSANFEFAILPVINKKFSELRDILTNIYDLLYRSEDSVILSKDLYYAAIEEKSRFVNSFPVENAVSFKPLKRYGLIFILSIILSGGIYLSAPESLSKGVKALFNPGVSIVTEEVYQYKILNDSLAVGRGDNFILEVVFRGNEIPANLHLYSWGNRFLMNKETNRKFTYTFRQVNNPVNFYLSDGSWKSREYDLKILPKPTLNNFSIHAEVPDYTGKSDIEKQNTGNITVPEGSNVSWKFYTSDVDTVKFSIGNTDTCLISDKQSFTYESRFYQSKNYTLGLKNKFFTDSNIIKYKVEVVKDDYPEIAIEQQKDTTRHTLRYFYGSISDDYGFSKLEFVISPGKNQESDTAYRVPINPNIDFQEIYFNYDFADLDESQDRYRYYFRVYDNDPLQGPKSAKSQIFTYNILQDDELDSLRQEQNKKMNKSLKEGMEIARELQKDLDELKNQSINENISSWERTKLLKDIENKQKQLNQVLKQTKDLSREKRNAGSKDDPRKESLMKKQKQLEKLMDEVMTDELKKLMEDIRKLQEEFNKKDMMKLQKDMEFSYEEMEKQLDRNMELMKKLQVEEQINRLAEEFNELAQRQEKLMQESDTDASDEELSKKQEQLKKDFKEAENKLDSTYSKNEDLQFPYKFDDLKEQRKEINKNFEDIQQLEQNSQEKNKLQQKQQQNAKDLKKLGQSLNQMMQQNMEEMTQLNADNLRQILSNLVKFSFDVEETLTKLDGINRRDPKFVEVLKNQKKQEDDFEVVRDSLYSLSKKSFMLDKAINDEIVSIAKNFRELLSFMEERKVKYAIDRERKILSSTNELALLLSEVLDNMRNNMGKGQGTPKPGKSGQPSVSQMKNMQKGLKKQLEKMLEQMKKSGKGKKGMSKELAKMLSEQEKFQKMLREMRQKGDYGKKMDDILRQIEKMTDEVKDDIIEKEITPETIKRQNNIVTRLLEAEDADRERDIEEKREAEKAKYTPMSNPDSVFPYNNIDKTFTEKLRLQRLKLRDFYEKKYKFYIQGIGQ